ncbi:hypothetical protein BH10BAC5_BH10BAC5_20420 [soil metagenome]
MYYCISRYAIIHNITMNKAKKYMKPQDIVILLKIILLRNKSWNQRYLSETLIISQSEISESISRSEYSGLIYENGRKVVKPSLLEFLQYGICYIFPEKPGSIVRGMPTAHSAYPLNEKIISEENYVWPTAKGNFKGQSIIPLYPSVPEAAKLDPELYVLLALIDSLRFGKIREKNLAIEEIKIRLYE